MSFARARDPNGSAFEMVEFDEGEDVVEGCAKGGDR
jgi:hypothetical protein